jgi:formylglycine-generating enzyme required for sulfatase activity
VQGRGGRENHPPRSIDWHAGSYAGAKNVDPQGPTSGSLRVLRGSGWTDPAFLCRSAFRGRASPDGRCDFVGFRVVVELK